MPQTPQQSASRKTRYGWFQGLCRNILSPPFWKNGTSTRWPERSNFSKGRKARSKTANRLPRRLLQAWQHLRQRITQFHIPPKAGFSARYSLCGAFVCPQSYKINMISVRRKAGLTHESTYGSLFVSERASNTHRLFAGKGAPTLRQAQCTASSATGNTVSNTDEITGLST